MMTDHTPGPWLPAQKANGASCRHPAIMSDEGQVANVTWMGLEAITNANASLISAAPDLLNALIMMLDAYDIPAAQRQARAAIKKALGGSQCQ